MRPLVRKSLLLLGILCIAVSASAQIPLPGFIIPVVAKSPGALGTDWATDVFISNLGPEFRTFSAHFFPADQANTFNGNFSKTGITVGKKKTKQAIDVIGTWFPSQGSSVKGWLLIADTTTVNCDDDDRTTAKAIVATRLYNKLGNGSSFGMMFESSLLAMNSSPFPSHFTSIRNQGNAKPGARTNLGVANISTSTITVNISLVHPGGQVLKTVSRVIPALSLKQWSLANLGMPVFGNLAGRLEVKLKDGFQYFDPCEDTMTTGLCLDRCDSDCGGKYGFGPIPAFVPYVSNIDNDTGDGEVILPVFDQIGYLEWQTEFIDVHCPDKSEGSILAHAYRQLEPFLEIQEQSQPPVFRKVVK
ncbi:MAG: hypothetical protein DRJ65_01110 [Acidobacteria bacterium]|nr:MAG: hypothetical protein DRJ65_01110 [Acidobacteriota bacterium]